MHFLQSKAAAQQLIHSESRLTFCECGPQGERFRVVQKSYCQFAQNYFARLTLMRPVLREVAAREFPGVRGVP